MKEDWLAYRMIVSSSYCSPLTTSFSDACHSEARVLLAVFHCQP